MFQEIISPMMEISLTIETEKAGLFFQLLEQGFFVAVPEGTSVRKTLCDYLDISGEYLENRIQTIFLDGKPVDDVDGAYVRKGSVIALSAAMPGLVGSTMRKGGYLAAFRSGISQKKESIPDLGRTADVTVKLFNLVAKDLGTRLLERGIRIPANRLNELLLNQDIVFRVKTGADSISRD